MSWQGYVDNSIVGAGLKSGAILGHDGSQWATSAGFAVQPDEAKKLVAGFSDPAGLRAGGIMIAKEKYFALQCNDRSIYGKKGAGGCVCVKTGKAVLVGVYDDRMQPGSAANIVEKVADYLIEQGY